MNNDKWANTFSAARAPWPTVDQFRAAIVEAADSLEAVKLAPPMREGDIALFAVAKDKMHLLERFLEHYRQLGVERFVIVDNNSTDGTPELLAKQRDVDLWSAKRSFADACDGRLWIDALVQADAIDRWCVFVDIDEVLVFTDMEKLGLRGLATALEESNERRLLAPQIDLYLRDRVPDSSESLAADLRSGSLWFDPWDYQFQRTAVGTVITGGLGARVLTKGSAHPILTKHPFQKTESDTLHPSPHFPFPFDKNPAFARGAVLRLEPLSEQRGTNPPLAAFWTAESRKYVCPETLVDAGLMLPAEGNGRRRASSIKAPSDEAEYDVIVSPEEHRKRFLRVGTFQESADRSARQLTRTKAAEIRGGPAVLVSVVRNEILLLPAFLNHYRNLGIRHFIIVDNGSTDGTLELLSKSPDVELYSTEASYAASLHGRLWIDGLTRAKALNRWVLHVDADEFLAYEGMETHGVDDLIRWLEAGNLKRLFAPMLDLYPANLESARTFQSGEDPLSTASLFDGRGYDFRVTCKGTLVYGGARCRLFSQKGRPITLEMAKHPLSFWDNWCANVWNHAPHPYDRNTSIPFAWLLHFKFLGEFKTRIERLVAEGQHWNGASSYRQILEGLGATDHQSSLSWEHSLKYDGPSSLIEAGLMRPVDWSSSQTP